MTGIDGADRVSMLGMSSRTLSFGVAAEATPPGRDMQWPGTELQRSEWFADVQQFVIERRLTRSARDYAGHLSTISACLELPASA
jgi:hypothetical protein